MLKAAAKSVGQHLLREAIHELIVPFQKYSLQANRTFKGYPTRQLSRVVRLFVLGSELADGIIIFEREAKRIKP